MYLLDEYKISGHFSPRTAGRSIGELFVQLGGRQVGGHHDEPQLPPKHYHSITIIRPHHEVWGVLIGGRGANRKLRERLGDHLKSENSTFVQIGPRGWEMYWRRHFCDSVLRFGPRIYQDVASLLVKKGVPEEKIPGLPLHLGGNRQHGSNLTEQEHAILAATFGPEMRELFPSIYDENNYGIQL